MSYVAGDLRRDVLLACNRARAEMTVEEASAVLTQVIADMGGTVPVENPAEAEILVSIKAVGKADALKERHA